jgi:electron transport complex protein RnfG
LPEGVEMGQEGVNPKVFAGYDEQGQFIGFAVTAEEPGFQDIIGGIFGYDPETEQIVGMEILESKETPGLGDKIFKDADFTAFFKALATEPEIVAVKKGERENPNEVEAITGATISSKAVVRMLNKGMGEWEEAMKAYAEKIKEGF